MRRLLQLALLVFVATGVRAQDVSLLYSTTELEEIGSRYRPNLRGLWIEDFLSQLTHDELARGGQVSLNLPLMGAKQQVLEWYSNPVTRIVYLPISSVKFIDDLAVAFAYYDNMGCDVGTVTDYTGALRFRSQELKGSPLHALGVPTDALKNASVDKLAQNILKSIVYFIVAHEYAHVMYRHASYNTISAQQAQRQEIEADAFALEVMRRIGVAPLALTFFFTIASRLEATPGDFASLSTYETYLQQRATHPVSAVRILRIADTIESQIDAFTRLEQDPRPLRAKLQVLVPQLRTIANGLDDRKMRDFLAARARHADLAAMRVNCRR